MTGAGNGTSSGSKDKLRVAIVFAGGPAPAANSVIGSAAAAFLEDGHEVLGFFHGYSNLQEYHPVSYRLVADKHYRVFTEKDLRGLRNARGIVIGTARANPGKMIKSEDDLKDTEKSSKLRNVYNAFVDLGVDALISIGGDDTLKTANLVLSFQKFLPEDAKRVRVIHLPKTIDNDYRGIDFTFGFFTAVDVMAKEVLNLRADALATSAYYIIETMGRKAGWLSYGVAIAGEANLVLSVEDVNDKADILKTGDHLDLNKLADYIVDLIITRESTTDKHYGTVVLAEGLAEMLPPEALNTTTVDEHGHIALGKLDLGKLVATVVSERFSKRTDGRQKKVTGVQLGYEARCGPPHAFDVMLGSQLGVGAYRALVEDNKNAVLVSCGGQLDVNYVNFEDLIDKQSLRAEVRFVAPGSDFHRLARFMETRVDHERVHIGSARKEETAVVGKPE